MVPNPKNKKIGATICFFFDFENNTSNFDRGSLGGSTKMEPTEMEMFDFLWLIWVHAIWGIIIEKREINNLFSFSGDDYLMTLFLLPWWAKINYLNLILVGYHKKQVLV